MFETDIVDIHPACRELHLSIARMAQSPLRELGIIAAGHGVQRERYEVRRGARRGHHILYSLAGEGWCRHQGRGKRLPLHAGSILITGDGMPQHFALAGASWEILWFVLEPAASRWLPASGLAASPQIQQGSRGGHLRAAVQGWHRELQSPQLGETEVCAGYAWQIGAFLQRDILPTPEPRTAMVQRAKLLQLRERVREDLASPWTVQSLADASRLHLCADHFARVCKATLGRTPLQMVTEQRMRKTAEFLLCTDYKLELMASLLGFGSAFALSTAFKRFYGQSPQAYRQSAIRNMGSASDSSD